MEAILEFTLQDKEKKPGRRRIRLACFRRKIRRGGKRMRR